MAYPRKELMFYAVQPGLLIFPVHYSSFLSWKKQHGLLLFEYKVDSSLNGKSHLALFMFSFSFMWSEQPDILSHIVTLLNCLLAVLCAFVQG